MVCIYNFVEYCFAQTERDVDKQKETEREITGERAGEKEWVHNDRWDWMPSNCQSSCNMTKITQESNSKKKKGAHVLVELHMFVF